MGDLLDFKCHKLRSYLRSKLGEYRLQFMLERFPTNDICNLVCYSRESKTVYVEPDILVEMINDGNPETLKNLNRILGVLQEAPSEIKALLRQDEASPHRGRA